MESIETAGKMGTYASLTALFTKLTDIANDPRLQVLMDFLDLWGKFLRELNAEEAGEIAEFLYSVENVRILKETAKAFKFVMEDTSGIQQSMMALDTTLNAFNATLLEVDFDKIGKEFAAMPDALVGMIKEGFRAATVDLGDWFKDWLEEMIEEALD